MNFVELRKQFPVFQENNQKSPCIFFDSAATAQVPQHVLDAMMRYYCTYKSNIGRGVYKFAEQATAEYESAREKIAQFIGAQKNEIIFTSGATASINMVTLSWALDNLKSGDEIFVSAIEHHSNFLPWQYLAARKGLILKLLPVDADGIIKTDIFEKWLSTKTKLVAVIHTSNVLGATNDVKKITQMAHEYGAKVLIDAAQSIAHQVIDVKDIDCDFLAFSGHKLFGPTGVGVLFIKNTLAMQIQPAMFGGGMVFSVDVESSKYKEVPHCFEAGTPPIAQAIGLGAAIDFINKYVDFNQLQKYETLLSKKLCDGLQGLSDIKILNPLSDSNHHEHRAIVSFVSKKYHAHDIAAYLDTFGIAVRAGHHCVQLFHNQQGINSSVRVSFSLYNTLAEVDCFLDCMKKLHS